MLAHLLIGLCVPQHVCLTSNNASDLHAMGLSSQFSGCLQQFELLYWNGTVFYVPDMGAQEANSPSVMFQFNLKTH